MKTVIAACALAMGLVLGVSLSGPAPAEQEGPRYFERLEAGAISLRSGDRSCAMELRSWKNGVGLVIRQKEKPAYFTCVVQGDSQPWIGFASGLHDKDKRYPLVFQVTEAGLPVIEVASKSKRYQITPDDLAKIGVRLVEEYKPSGDK